MCAWSAPSRAAMRTTVRAVSARCASGECARTGASSRPGARGDRLLRRRRRDGLRLRRLSTGGRRRARGRAASVRRVDVGRSAAAGLAVSAVCVAAAASATGARGRCCCCSRPSEVWLCVLTRRAAGDGRASPEPPARAGLGRARGRRAAGAAVGLRRGRGATACGGAGLLQRGEPARSHVGRRGRAARAGALRAAPCAGRALSACSGVAAGAVSGAGAPATAVPGRSRRRVGEPERAGLGRGAGAWQARRRRRQESRVGAAAAAAGRSRDGAAWSCRHRSRPCRSGRCRRLRPRCPRLPPWRSGRRLRGPRRRRLPRPARALRRTPGRSRRAGLPVDRPSGAGWPPRRVPRGSVGSSGGSFPLVVRW